MERGVRWTCSALPGWTLKVTSLSRGNGWKGVIPSHGTWCQHRCSYTDSGGDALTDPKALSWWWHSAQWGEGGPLAGAGVPLLERCLCLQLAFIIVVFDLRVLGVQTVTNLRIYEDLAITQDLTRSGKVIFSLWELLREGVCVFVCLSECVSATVCLCMCVCVSASLCVSDANPGSPKSFSPDL